MTNAQEPREPEVQSDTRNALAYQRRAGVEDAINWLLAHAESRPPKTLYHAAGLLARQMRDELMPEGTDKLSAAVQTPPSADAAMVEELRRLVADAKKRIPYHASEWHIAADRALASRQPAGVEESKQLLALRAIKAVTATTKDAVAGLSRIMSIARHAGVPEPYSELLADPDVALLVNEPRAAWQHLLPAAPATDEGEAG